MSWYMFKDTPTYKPRGKKVEGYNGTIFFIKSTPAQGLTFHGESTIQGCPLMMDSPSLPKTISPPLLSTNLNQK